MTKPLRHIDSAMKGRRATLRARMPTPEVLLWQQLRREQLGAKFRRQHSVGSFILDFYAPVPRLAIEIDGDTHFASVRARDQDRRRDALLSCEGIRVLRFTNTEIRESIAGVCQNIADVLRGRLTPPPTPPLEEGESADQFSPPL
ncbi:MAG: endonuclease domain-containing protein [Candidatus Uhrbacteria bacterium]